MRQIPAHHGGGAETEDHFQSQPCRLRAASDAFAVAPKSLHQQLLSLARSICGPWPFAPILRDLTTKQPKQVRPLDDLNITSGITVGNRRVIQFENGTIEVEVDRKWAAVAKPILREICKELNISLLNTNNNPKNTRQLGAEIIAASASTRHWNAPTTSPPRDTMQ